MALKTLIRACLTRLSEPMRAWEPKSRTSPCQMVVSHKFSEKETAFRSLETTGPKAGESLKLKVSSKMVTQVSLMRLIWALVAHLRPAHSFRT